jgi:hypothetical protein
LPRAIDGPTLDEVIDAELVGRPVPSGDGARADEDADDISRPEDI